MFKEIFFPFSFFAKATMIANILEIFMRIKTKSIVAKQQIKGEHYFYAFWEVYQLTAVSMENPNYQN